MIMEICPYCETGIGILFDSCLYDLAIKGESTCKCTNCNRDFIVFCGTDKIETKRDDSIILKKE